MSKEEAVSRAMCIADSLNPDFNYDPNGLRRTDDFRWCLYIPKARAAIAAADKWDAEQRAATCKHPRAQGVGSTWANAVTMWSCPDCGANYDSRKPSGSKD